MFMENLVIKQVASHDYAPNVKMTSDVQVVGNFTSIMRVQTRTVMFATKSSAMTLFLISHIVIKDGVSGMQDMDKPQELVKLVGLNLGCGVMIWDIFPLMKALLITIVI
jgi:hypothetical protein